MSLNYRPIIGILAQENWEGDPDAQGSSYVQASYVKHLESAGARVVPIHINQTKEEYVKLFNSINGLLLPGGNVDMEKSQCARTTKIFYDLAIKANDASDYFPIWGTCQGFQQLTILTSNKYLLTPTDTKGSTLPLIFTPVDYVKPHGALCSLLFADAILVARACERQKEKETREWTGQVFFLSYEHSLSWIFLIDGEPPIST